MKKNLRALWAFVVGAAMIMPLAWGSCLGITADGAVQGVNYCEIFNCSNPTIWDPCSVFDCGNDTATSN